VSIFRQEKSSLFWSINHSMESSWVVQHFLSWVSGQEIWKSWSKKFFFDVCSKIFNE